MKPYTATRKKRIFLRCLGAVLAVLAALLLLCRLLLSLQVNRSVRNLIRVDEDGFLYSADYTGSYGGPLYSLALRLFRGGNCSAFLTLSDRGDVLTCRNYDLTHLDREGNPTGLNVVLFCSPENGYRSVNVADAGWASYLRLPYSAGALDNSRITKLPLLVLPYLCMDGMNEKGVSVSILALDLREGESAVFQRKPGQKTVLVSELLRMILDQCADLPEAVALAQSCNMASTLGNDYHLFVTDASGASAVLEWRYDTLYITETDAVTNFYVGFDDACDCYWNGKLKEVFEEPADFSLPYRYGYGHGYGRFASLAEALEAHRGSGTEPAVMTGEEAFGVLAGVAQPFDPEGMRSMTQYSVIYNATKRCAELRLPEHPETVYSFALEGPNSVG